LIGKGGLLPCGKRRRIQLKKLSGLKFFGKISEPVASDHYQFTGPPSAYFKGAQVRNSAQKMMLSEEPHVTFEAPKGYGVKGSTLALNNLTHNQMGYYDVIVSNPFGVVVSAKVLLSVGQTSVLVWGSGGNYYPATPTNVPAGLTNAGGSAMSSNAMLKVLVPQRLSAPQFFPDGSFGFSSRAADGGTLQPSDLAGFEVQASTNLVDWVSLPGALTLTNGVLQLRDPAAASARMRFYRIIEDP
jgi:hypothetical protein